MTRDLTHWQPRPTPDQRTLQGRFVRLEALEIRRHGDDLWRALQGTSKNVGEAVSARQKQAKKRSLRAVNEHFEPVFNAAMTTQVVFRGAPKGPDPALWDYLPYGPFSERAAFDAWLAGNASSRDPLFYAVLDKASGKALGLFSYLRITPQDGCIEIGHVAFGAPMQRTPGATEAVYLLARHAFDDLAYRRLEWKCDAANARSMRAAERFGFTAEGLFRQHMVRKGRNRDTAWFAIIDGDWPALRDGFQRWLAQENFDAEGRQKQRLEALRG